MADKEHCFNLAVEITKEHARGGSQSSIAEVLESVYRKLVELDEDTRSS